MLQELAALRVEQRSAAGEWGRTERDRSANGGLNLGFVEHMHEQLQEVAAGYSKHLDQFLNLLTVSGHISHEGRRDVRGRRT